MLDKTAFKGFFFELFNSFFQLILGGSFFQHFYSCLANKLFQLIIYGCGNCVQRLRLANMKQKTYLLAQNFIFNINTKDYCTLSVPKNRG